MTLSIAVFSDPVCPWCFLGKRRLDRALAELGLSDETLVRWLPFELNPAMPADGMERAAYRAQKFGPDRAVALDREMADRGFAEGIRFAFDRQERTPNTRKAHLLIAHASRQGRGDAAVEALFSAYFAKGQDIGRESVLLDLAAHIGLDWEAAAAALGDTGLAASVADLEAEAVRLGVEGVPFFILNGAWAVSGAQPVATWREVIRHLPAPDAPEA